MHETAFLIWANIVCIDNTKGRHFCLRNDEVSLNVLSAAIIFTDYVRSCFFCRQYLPCNGKDDRPRRSTNIEEPFEGWTIVLIEANCHWYSNTCTLERNCIGNSFNICISTCIFEIPRNWSISTDFLQNIYSYNDIYFSFNYRNSGLCCKSYSFNIFRPYKCA